MFSFSKKQIQSDPFAMDCTRMEWHMDIEQIWRLAQWLFAAALFWYNRIEIDPEWYAIGIFMQFTPKFIPVTPKVCQEAKEVL